MIPLRSFRILLTISLASTALQARFMQPLVVPLDQMEAHFSQLLKQDPGNADVLYRLGRVQYLAFDMGVEAAYTFNKEAPGNGLPGETHVASLVADTAKQARLAAAGEKIKLENDYGERSWSIKVMTPEERVAHAEKAKKFLEASLEQNPKSGLTWLTYGLFVTTWLETKELHTVRGARALQKLKAGDALEAFEKAYQLEGKTDLSRRFLPVEGPGGMISHEAARSWLDVATKVGSNDSTTKRAMERHLKSLSKLKVGAVTPVLFHPGKKAEDPVPVDPDLAVKFDMPGDGSGGTWTWPQAGSVLLVWNPAGTARNLNGSMLFGGYTWEMFWEHGFEALAILDMDHDGVLQGDELEAISGWQDLPPYGVCATKELKSLADFGLKALYLKHWVYEGKEALVWNPAGLEMQDGRRLPLWDWLAQPVAPHSN